MTVNIVASFKRTGIQPFDRTVIKLPGQQANDKEKEYITEKVAFVPFFSSSVNHQHVDRQIPDQDPDHTSDLSINTVNSQICQMPLSEVPKPYTESELALFQTRYENGYNLSHDKRYNSWLRENHPQVTILAQPQTAASQLLPPPPTA